MPTGGILYGDMALYIHTRARARARLVLCRSLLMLKINNIVLMQIFEVTSHKIEIEGKIIEQVSNFNYLGSLISN
jgi:hypothetical protein